MEDIKKYTVKLVKEQEMEYKGGKVTSSKKASKLINKIFNMDSQPSEIFVMLALDVQKKPTGCFLISQGTINSTISSPRDIFQRALLVNAHSIIVAHNHPSGEVEPSPEDIRITQRLTEAGKLMEIELIDHLIIGEEGKYYSFLENGVL